MTRHISAREARSPGRMAMGIKIAAVLMITALYAPALSAQDCEDVSGDWDVTISLPDATTQEVLLSLEQDGCDLTGMITGANETAIEGGKAEGATFTFNISVNNQADGQQLEFTWEGTRDGDSISGTWGSEMVGALTFTGSKAHG